ncbi:peptidase inhibitor family I36 protein [Nonomuraea candida]|uniref:peptidase inhibitor family I36 protein n=1 Tax=Nonomuraea candida TaxID=359159 RepID=UPI0005BC755E|nr:peptidase inhibitor family I36 protein [Nonomuraea candida]
MRKILVTLAAMVVAALGLAAPSSATSSAADQPIVLVNEKGESIRVVPVRASEVGVLAFSDCPNGYGCFWAGLNGSGSRWDAPQCTGGGYYNLSGSWLDNNIESVRNRGGGTIHLYYNSTANDYMRSIENNGVGVNLSDGHRNQASSIRIDC